MRVKIECGKSPPRDDGGAIALEIALQGNLAHEKVPPTLGPPYQPQAYCRVLGEGCFL